MAKGNPFMGSLSGKMGDVVFYRQNGEQILRPRIRRPRNPQTTKQMAQRVQIGTSVRFFNRGTKAFFKFAFENKKRFESDFNAFIKTNNGKVPPNTKSAYDQNMPAIGNYVLTQGTLATPRVAFEFQQQQGNAHPALIIPGLTTDPRTKTIGEVSRLLCKAYSLIDGDIVTIVGITHPAKPYSNIEDMIAGNGLTTYDHSIAQPLWNISQFTIDTSSSALCSTLGVFGDVEPSTNRVTLLEYSAVNYLDENCFGFAVVFSRGSGRSLKVSYSRIENNLAVKTAIQIAMSSEWFEYCANSFNLRDIIVKNSGETILEGGISVNQPVPVEIDIPAIAWYPQQGQTSKTKVLKGFAMDEFNSTTKLRALVEISEGEYDVEFTRSDNNTLEAVVEGKTIKFNRGFGGINYNLTCNDSTTPWVIWMPYKFVHNGKEIFYKEHINPWSGKIEAGQEDLTFSLIGDVPDAFTDDTTIVFVAEYGGEDIPEIELEYVSPDTMVANINTEEIRRNRLTLRRGPSGDFNIELKDTLTMDLSLILSHWYVGSQDLILNI